MNTHLERPASKRTGIDGIEIIAHRGASSDAPENTLASIELAWQQNADSIEIDIHQTRDGHLVVMHDANTLRTTGVSGKIEEMTLEEIRRLDAGSWKDAAFAGEKVPTLDELLAAGSPGKRRFFLEIKARGVSMVLLQQAIARAGLTPGQLVIMSFIEEVARNAKQVFPETPVLWLVDSYERVHKRGAGGLSKEGLIRRALEDGLDGLGLCKDWPLDASFLSDIRDAGLEIYVWTVNEVEAARRLIEMGVTGLISDRARWMREQLLEEAAPVA